MEVGTLAPIEVVRAEAEIASREQTLTVAETRVLQQETILKTALSKTGVSSPAIQAARIIPTDQIRVPDVEPITPIQEMVGQALSSRPELAQSRIQLQNQELTIRGSKNALLPTLDVVASTSNSALAGEPNPLPPLAGSPRSNTAFFIGGYGTVLSQLFSRNFPNYSHRVQPEYSDAQSSGAGAGGQRPAHVPAAAARAAAAGESGAGRRAERDDRGVAGAGAITGRRRRRRCCSSRRWTRSRRSCSSGASTIYNVILAERDLVTAQSNPVSAEAAYAKARVELDRATGQILYNNNVSMDEAVKGVVSRPPSRIPDTPPVPQSQR